MSDNLNNQLDFYRNQIPSNQENQANVVMRRDRGEISFQLDSNFLQSSLNKILEKNLQNIENYNQNFAHIRNAFQVLGQEIINIKNDFYQAIGIQENKINNIQESNNEVNEKCLKFYEKWENEDLKNKENIKNVNEILNENNNKIVNEINCQSKKLDESIMKNNLENNNIKNEFKILKNNLNLAQNKNDGNENLIKNLTDICNNNNKKINELEAKLTNLENNYKNNNEISKIKTNVKDNELKIKDNLNNISEFENKFKKYKDTNDNNIKDLQGKINEANDNHILNLTK